MSVPNRETSWSQNEILMWYIAKKLEEINKILGT